MVGDFMKSERAYTISPSRINKSGSLVLDKRDEGRDLIVTLLGVFPLSIDHPQFQN